MPLDDAMGRLIVYCRSVPYKKNEVSGDCCETYSFSDNIAQDYISAQPRGKCYVNLSGYLLLTLFEGLELFRSLANRCNLG